MSHQINDRRRKSPCECGCGRLCWPSELKEVEVEEAIDETLRSTQTQRTFMVYYKCREPFLEELGLMAMVQTLVRAHARAQRKTFWQRFNLSRTFRLYIMRVRDSFRIMRYQHGIYIRTKGFEYARRRSIQSAWLMAVPRFMQGCLARHWKGSLSLLLLCLTSCANPVEEEYRAWRSKRDPQYMATHSQDYYWRAH